MQQCLVVACLDREREIDGVGGVWLLGGVCQQEGQLFGVHLEHSIHQLLFDRALATTTTTQLEAGQKAFGGILGTNICLLLLVAGRLARLLAAIQFGLPDSIDRSVAQAQHDRHVTCPRVVNKIVVNKIDHKDCKVKHLRPDIQRQRSHLRDVGAQLAMQPRAFNANHRAQVERRPIGVLGSTVGAIIVAGHGAHQANLTRLLLGGGRLAIGQPLVRLHRLQARQYLRLDRPYPLFAVVAGVGIEVPLLIVEADNDKLVVRVLAAAITASFIVLVANRLELAAALLGAAIAATTGVILCIGHRNHLQALGPIAQLGSGGSGAASWLLAGHLDGGVLQRYALAMHIVHVVVQRPMICQAAIDGERHVLLLPVLVQRLLALLVKIALLQL